MKRRSIYAIATALLAFAAWQAYASLIVVSGSVGTDAGGGGSASYAATHYVAPFADVSGASNDYADMGATAWSNCADDGGSPAVDECTLGTALARAGGGDQVQVAPGTYTGADLEDRNEGAFHAVGGSSGNRVVFFAQYPAAENYGSTSLYSSLEMAPVNFGGNASAIMDSDGYTIFDGFYADETNAPSAPNGGMFQISATGTEYRRIAVDRDDGDVAYEAGMNNNVFYFSETSYDGVVTDCLVIGNSPNGGNAHNRSTIETYSAIDAIIEHNTLIGGDVAIYFKTNGSGPDNPNPHTIATARYNWVEAGMQGITYQKNASLTIHHNVAIVAGTGGGDMLGLSYDTGTSPPQTDFLVHHNTVILTGDGSNSEPFIAGISFEDGAAFQGTFRDNLVYVASGTGEISLVSMIASTGNDFDDFTQFDYNYYYRASGTPEWHYAGTDYQNIGDWQTALSGLSADQNSGYGDPQFTNYAGGDYTLANNGQAARTASSTGGLVGAYELGTEEIGHRMSPSY